MKIDLTQFRKTFLQESADHIATMESGLLALRTAPDDTELLNSIFRSAHSIKGGAGSFGLEQLAHFTHGLENLLDRLREGQIRVTDEMVALLLESVDVLRALLEPDAEGVLPAGAEALAGRIASFASQQTGDQPAGREAETAGAGEKSEPEEASPVALWQVRFQPDREVFASGTNPIVLLRNLAELGDASASQLHSDDLPALAELDPAQCCLSWTVEMASGHSEQEIRDVFEFVEHLAEISVTRMERGRQTASVASQAAAARPAGSRPPAPRSPGKGAPGAESTSIRVATEKVDRLIDLVGELVIAHVMTAQMVDRFTPDCLPRLRESVAAMERNTRELHERVMAVRMLPVGTLFQRYTRTVFDIAQATGKQIALALSGEEAEVDKSMLEMLADPLTHLIRNAADHGIETPEQRTAAGKPAEGTITLRAFHRAGRVVIEVSDNGAGIDPGRVRAKAVERGLIAADAQMSEEQLRMLIFEPGFSTRDEVSDLSGRGVGMDVVRQNVQQLNGTVSLTSEVGAGSTVSIELPLTLAILEGLLIRVGDRTLVLPLLAVVETVSPRAGQIQRVAEKGEVVQIRDESVPLLRLRRFLGLGETNSSGEKAGRSLIVVVEAGHRKVGLVVDELLGQQQVVVKSLERHLRKIDGLMGATILGDGCVAPILDPGCLAGMNLFSLTTPGATAEFTISDPTGERGESAHAMV